MKQGYVIAHSSDKWTCKYHGVQHANVDLTAKGIRQVTVITYPSFAEVYALPLVGFTPVWEETHDTAKQARQSAESRWF